MAQLLNPDDYLLVSFTHNLASCVGSIGKLEMNASVNSMGVTYQTILNGKVWYDCPSAVTAAQHYNMAIASHER